MPTYRFEYIVHPTVDCESDPIEAETEDEAWEIAVRNHSSANVWSETFDEWDFDVTTVDVTE